MDRVTVPSGPVTADFVTEFPLGRIVVTETFTDTGSGVGEELSVDRHFDVDHVGQAGLRRPTCRGPRCASPWAGRACCLCCPPRRRSNGRPSARGCPWRRAVTWQGLLWKCVVSHARDQPSLPWRPNPRLVVSRMATSTPAPVLPPGQTRLAWIGPRPRAGIGRTPAARHPLPRTDVRPTGQRIERLRGHPSRDDRNQIVGGVHDSRRLARRCRRDPAPPAVRPPAQSRSAALTGGLGLPGEQPWRYRPAMIPVRNNTNDSTMAVLMVQSSRDVTLPSVASVKPAKSVQAKRPSTRSNVGTKSSAPLTCLRRLTLRRSRPLSRMECWNSRCRRSPRRRRSGWKKSRRKVPSAQSGAWVNVVDLTQCTYRSKGEKQ